MMLRIITLLLVVFHAQMVVAEIGIHAEWDALLQQYVRPINNGSSSQVDYQGIAQDKDRLDAYLDNLSAISREEFDRWNQHDQLAFLINAYNAWTVKLVLRKFPDIDSIKDLGSFFRSPWEIEFIPLLGSMRSLDNVEHKLIRGSDRYNDPRVHFALNCASVGCPALQAKAYLGTVLDAQLERSVQQFLADRTRNYLKGETLYISSIFKWYRKDFEQGWRAANNLASFLALYGNALSLDSTNMHRLRSGDIDIEFLDYDWQLNKTTP